MNKRKFDRTLRKVTIKTIKLFYLLIGVPFTLIVVFGATSSIYILFKEYPNAFLDMWRIFKPIFNLTINMIKATFIISLGLMSVKSIIKIRDKYF